MRKTIIRTAALLCALTMTAAVFTGCSDKDKDSDSKAKSGKSDSAAEKTSSDSKVDIYLDADGIPYYYNADGTKMMLFSSEMTSSDAGMDTSQSRIYDSYDESGLAFTIPEGWYADNAYGSPTILKDSADDATMFDEYITMIPSYYIVMTEEDGVVTEELLTDFLANYSGYTDYSITDTGDAKVGENDAVYFDVTASAQNLDTSDIASFRSRYIFTSGDNSYCIVITGLDDDDSMNGMIELYNSFADTIKLPTAEEMNAGLDGNEFSDEDLDIDAGDFVIDDDDIALEDIPDIDESELGE